MSNFGAGGNFTDQIIFPDFQIPSPPSDSDSNSGHHRHSDFNKILLTAIVSLSVVLLAVFGLHLYARFYLRRRARRHAAIHRLSLAVAHYSSGDDNSGLDPSVIASLPTFVFKRQPNSQNDNVADSSPSVLECSVCLSNLEDEETARLLPNCKHVFHVGCIDTWLASRSTCPVCRTPVRPVFMRVEPQPREGPAGEHVAPTSTTSSGEPVADDTTTSSDSGAKINGSNSRLNSFRRILSRERSISRIQPSSDDSNADRDLERQ